MISPHIHHDVPTVLNILSTVSTVSTVGDRDIMSTMGGYHPL